LIDGTVVNCYDGTYQRVHVGDPCEANTCEIYCTELAGRHRTL